ncbi:hypothetical protein [Pseudomonas sp. LFM046]|uniref:hypothetical protein n=1 Tax=Pseudomonas sp. LFM046 TaxID=1608357 RepID=UPI000AC53931|nr:hypothetical protein [Pseudomonas sp. LFM046]
MSGSNCPAGSVAGQGPVLFHPLARNVLGWLIAVVMAVLVGCASPRAPEVLPPIEVSPGTWREVDRDIVAASLAATGEARTYAQASMEHWMDLVYQRTDSDYIPWFSSFWTRKWLSIKVAFYRLNSDGDRQKTVDRLAADLQEAYDDRVLEPVARETSPDQIMEQATRLYIQKLDERVQVIPERFGVPEDQFDRHLQKIPAIAQAPTQYSASLFQVLHADPLEELPAYAALMSRIRNSPSAGAWATDEGLSNITRETSDQLETEIAASGAASLVSGLMGRVAGSVLSLGVTGLAAMIQENERPGREAQLRKNLNDAFDEEWLELMRNPETGVMAGVLHVSGQVEGSLGRTETQPIQFEPLPPRVVPLPWD